MIFPFVRRSDGFTGISKKMHGNIYLVRVNSNN